MGSGLETLFKFQDLTPKAQKLSYLLRKDKKKLLKRKLKMKQKVLEIKQHLTSPSSRRQKLGAADG